MSSQNAPGYLVAAEVGVLLRVSGTWKPGRVLGFLLLFLMTEMVCNKNDPDNKVYIII